MIVKSAGYLTLLALFLLPFTESCLPPPTCPSPSSVISSTGGKIVGGIVVEKNSLYWQAGLTEGKEGGNLIRCGGTLLSSKTVLTAASCSNTKYVVLGEHDERVIEGEEVWVEVCGSLEHPRYNSTSFDYDFKLLTLCKAVSFSKIIAPACLPATCQGRGCQYEDKAAVVSGWGSQSSAGLQPYFLMKAEVATMSNKCCCKPHKQHVCSSIDDSMICAASPGKDACNADKGGPLIIDAEKGNATLIGVFSRNNGCAQANYPGVYSRVTHVLDWIKSNLQGDQTCGKPAKKNFGLL